MNSLRWIFRHNVLLAFAAGSVCAFALLVPAEGARNRFPLKIESFDGKVRVQFRLTDKGVPEYRIDYREHPVVEWSRLGFDPGFRDTFALVATGNREHRGEWTNKFGERRTVPDNYRELTADLRHASGRKLRLIFRAYNEGAAFRYAFPPQRGGNFEFSAEHTEFRLPPGSYGYAAYGTEGEYQRVPVGQIQPYCERPLTVEYAGGFFASLGEAHNEAYARMQLSPLEGVAGALVSALGGTGSNLADRQRSEGRVRMTRGSATPWRAFVVGDRPGDLLERNYLILNLNPPQALADTSWIKPGKVMRDTTLSTANSKAIIDFAPIAGLQYVHLDWRWYGPEDLETGDATQVRVPNLDLMEVIRYGTQKGVGLILYVDRRQIRKQRDLLFPLYERWGVKGVKIGFIDVGPQRETAWTTETIRKAAEHHLMLNIHDGYRSMGLERTYPNLMTVEGIRGNEHFPSPEHNATLPFTRYVAGVGDYTICYYDRRLKTTHAHQLAMAVVSFSPLQWILWYDRPDMYDGEPELEFFREVPTVWDETRVLKGEIGRVAAIARRNGAQWFAGVVNNSEPRRLELPMRFLTPGQPYQARIYFDDDSAATRTKVGIEDRTVTSESTLTLDLKPAGGAALWIRPAPSRN